MPSRCQQSFWDEWTSASRQRTASAPIVNLQEAFYDPSLVHHDDQTHSLRTSVDSPSTSAPETSFIETYRQRNSRSTTSQSEAATSENIYMPLPYSNSERSQIMLPTTSDWPTLPDDDMMSHLHQQISQDQSACYERSVVRPPAEYCDPQFSIACTQQIIGREHLRSPMEIVSPGVTTRGRRANFYGYCDSSRQGNPIGHDKRNCPVLANMPPCPRCGANSLRNHTEMYCPLKKTELERPVVRSSAEYCDISTARTQQITSHLRPPMEIVSPGRPGDFCKYCASSNQGNPIGHHKRNCPILANMPPCPRCGADGLKNHTVMYCPLNKTELKLKRNKEEHEKFLNSVINRKVSVDLCYCPPFKQFRSSKSDHKLSNNQK